ncbi:MAG: VTT domain-containing protein [Deltaproteobacteria bacterium]|nr:VTT domain-containing protein [Deltaproteobacteria bacterium]
MILILIVGGLTLILYETGVIQFFLNKKRMAQYLNSLGPWSVVVFVLLQVAQVVAAPIPGEVTGFLGGYLFGKFFGVVLSTIGLTLGSYLAFVLARTFGRPLIEKFIPKSTIQRFDYLLHHKAAFLVFLLFLIPGFPKDWLCYILGLGHLTTTEFLVIGGTGRLFGTILLTLGGSYLRHHQYIRFYILVGIGISVVIVALAYRDKLDRVFRFWHLKGLRKRRQIEAAQRDFANHVNSK